MDTASFISLLTENGPGVVFGGLFFFLYRQEKTARIEAETQLKQKLNDDITLYRNIALRASTAGGV